MTTKELVELASLDSLGLLDAVESAVFTRSFHDATATVQDEVVRLQAEVAGDLVLLPGEEPDSGLRQRVLSAVAEAIAREESQLAPLARIGRRRRDAQAQGWRLGASGQLWRAAAFALASTTVVSAYFFADAYHTSNDLFQYVFNDAAQRLEVLQPTPIDFLVDDSVKITLKPLDDNAPYRGCVMVNEAAEKAMVLVEDLPTEGGREYVLQVVLNEGGTQEIQAFKAPAGFGGVRVEVPARVIADADKWQIADRDGAILLSSA